MHVEAHLAFDAVADEFHAEPLAVVSPDPGGVKRAQLWREHLERRRGGEVGFALLDKRRSADVMSGLATVVGEVRGATVLLVDDLVATGHTLVRAAAALREAGARRVIACAAHGLFVRGADHTLGDPALDRVVVCDSVPAFRVAPASPLHGKLQVVSCVPLFAEAIRESHAAWSR
jgi:ribose-phosphate pyrophosphokinase